MCLFLLQAYGITSINNLHQPLVFSYFTQNCLQAKQWIFKESLYHETATEIK